MDKMLKFTEVEGFTAKEKAMNSALCELFGDWVEKLKSAESNDPFRTEHFVSDGFYPGYSEQTPKVLYVGRESYGIGGCSNTFVLYNAYMEKRVNDKHLNQFAFHKRLLKIAYGLTHSCCPWAEIPKATDLVSTFGKEGGFSFAFMNLCKISNEEPQGDFNQCNQKQIAYFLEATRNTGRNFIAEEIGILDPDVIIAMNFAEDFHHLGQAEQLTDNADAHLWRLTVNGKRYPLINAYHFAASKEDQAVFYDPIVACVKQATTLL